MKKTSALLLLILLLVSRSEATTWDEPWADDVLAKASSFVLAKVTSNDEAKGITIHVLKTLGGQELKGELLVNDFYLLNLCSSSGHGVEFQIAPTDSCYFFLSRNKEGKYCIATPTTGFSPVFQGSVAATYRHSYHKALVPVGIYEKTMTALFRNYHNLPYDKFYMTNFINEYLNKTPASIDGPERSTFFLQHVALESVHHLKINVKDSQVLPFLNDKENFHSQVSAARAMVVFNTPSGKQQLLKIVNDTTQNNFVQVICIWTLGTFSPKELKPQLEKSASSASDESGGFGGNIMDPRVCTHIPSVKEALNDLISKL